MSRLLFTGERLHEDDALFGVDLMRHRAAYAHALRTAEGLEHPRVLDLGCGTGYGTADLASSDARVFAIDRIRPDPENRHPEVQFIRADAGWIPLRQNSFDMVVSFQVIEHLENPTPYLQAIQSALRPGGIALISTPNRLESEGENPFHVHEYTALELQEKLEDFFSEVSMLGVGTSETTRAYHNARLKRIRSIARLDPLGLRRRLPRRVVTRLFAFMATLVRRRIARDGGLPRVNLDDFPIMRFRDDCLDLLAVCRKSPRSGVQPVSQPE